MVVGVQTIKGQSWSSGLEPARGAVGGDSAAPGVRATLLDTSVLDSLFKSIPPERVGLHGEYDHSGLAKRVKHALQSRFLPQELGSLAVNQRGRVVILTGQVASPTLLAQIVDLALGVKGAAYVEAHGVAWTD